MIIKLPGLIDSHVHLRDPGAEHKEDFFTGTCSALAGGFTAVIDMPNNPVSTVSNSALQEKKLIAGKKAVCDIGFYFGADQNNWQEAKKIFKQVFGLKIYMDHTTGSLLVTDLKILNEHFASWPGKKPILVHAEDATLAKAVGLAFSHKKWLHVCHVSTAQELELIIKAKKAGAIISCECTPHHLFLTAEDEKNAGGYLMMRPQLKTKKDQQALWWGINHKIIDMIGTDHAPHTKQEKSSINPPFGVPGLETALPLMLTALNENKISLFTLKKLMFVNPTRIHGIKQPDSWIEVDMNKKWTIDNQKLFTKCGWSPFDGKKVKGKLISVYLRGKKVFEDGNILAKKGSGRVI